MPDSTWARWQAARMLAEGCEPNTSLGAGTATCPKGRPAPEIPLAPWRRTIGGAARRCAAPWPCAVPARCGGGRPGRWRSPPPGARATDSRWPPPGSLVSCRPVPPPPLVADLSSSPRLCPLVSRLLAWLPLLPRHTRSIAPAVQPGRAHRGGEHLAHVRGARPPWASCASPCGAAAVLRFLPRGGGCCAWGLAGTLLFDYLAGPSWLLRLQLQLPHRCQHRRQLSQCKLRAVA